MPNEMGRGGVSVVAVAVFTRLSAGSNRLRICRVSGVALWMAFSRDWLSEHIVMRSVRQLALAQSGTSRRYSDKGLH